MTASTRAPIVVGVDGSQLSLRATELAAGEAVLRGRPLQVFHAFAWPPVTTGVVPGIPAPSIRAAQATADAIVSEAVELARKVAPDIATGGRSVTGGPVPALIEASRDAHLLVVGEPSIGGFGGVLVGSAAVQTAAHSVCPVLVARSAERPSGPVVVGVDGSRTSELALAVAAEEADLRRATLIVLHAWDAASSTELDDIRPAGVAFSEGEATEDRVLAESLAGLSGRYLDLRIERRVANGRPWELLTTLSRTAQLVVVGSRGHGEFTGLLLGSVSRYLIHHASCPVLVARPRAAAPGG
jgi:nucleotide-binding universal stress UspA family protein